MEKSLITLFVALFLVSACVFYPVMSEEDVAARRTVQAEALLPTVTPAPEEATATAVVVEATMEATPAPECLVKGNVSSSGEKIYHVPGGASYDRTIVDPEHGEQWFCSVLDAETAGFRTALR